MTFLDRLNGQQRDQLLNAGRRRKVADRAVIIEHGDESTDVFVIVAGAAMATLISAQGHIVAYRAICPGDIFGELAALTGAPRNAWVHARGETEICAIPYVRFERMMMENPALAMELSRHLARMVADLSARLYERSALVVRQRLGLELVRRASPADEASDGGSSIPQLPPHAELAAFIGTHREAVTKELAAFAREGLIRKEGRRIVIPSLQALLSALDGESGWR